MTKKDDERFEKEIAELLRGEFAETARSARVPPAEIVWMRAELRAREEATRKAVRPLVFGQALGVAAFCGLLVALLSRFPVTDLPRLPIGLVDVVVGSWLVLAPLALYLALSRE